MGCGPTIIRPGICFWHPQGVPLHFGIHKGCHYILAPTRGAATRNTMYAGVQHGFHNDTTPRYDEKAARLGWSRTVTFLNKYLKS